MKKKSSFMKKPSFKPKKDLPQSERLDEELGMLNLTKDEAEKRLLEYVTPMIMNKLKSAKWESKVIGIQWLQEWIVSNGSNHELVEYTFRYLKGIMKDWKETNSNLTKASSECIYEILKSCERLGRRPISYIIPYLCEKLVDNLVKDYALESILFCAELNNKCFGSIGYTVKQLMKYGPKTNNHIVLKETFSCILLIVDSFGAEGIQLHEIFKFVVFGCCHKAVEVRNEAIMVIKQFYMMHGEEVKNYLDDIKPSTMAVINQELDSIELPEHLKNKFKRTESEDLEMLASPEKKEQEDSEEEAKIEEREDFDQDYQISPFKEIQDDQEDEEEKQEMKSTVESIKSSDSRKTSGSKFNKSSKFNSSQKSQGASESQSFIEIYDVGNKDVRDQKDSKALWVPGELRTDIMTSIQNQIKAAFGPKIESD